MKFATLILTLAGLALAFSNCKKDDSTESENITKVKLHFMAAGFEQEFEAAETNGDGIWDTIDEITLPLNTTDIECHVYVFDETQNPVEDLTVQIRAESTAHIFTYNVTGANLSIKPNDADANNLPFNLETLWDTGAFSSGTVQIKLHHEPSDKNAADPGGEIDFDLSFPVKIQ